MSRRWSKCLLNITGTPNFRATRFNWNSQDRTSLRSLSGHFNSPNCTCMLPIVIVHTFLETPWASRQWAHERQQLDQQATAAHHEMLRAFRWGTMVPAGCNGHPRQRSHHSDPSDRGRLGVHPFGHEQCARMGQLLETCPIHMREDATGGIHGCIVFAIRLRGACLSLPPLNNPSSAHDAVHAPKRRQGLYPLNEEIHQYAYEHERTTTHVTMIMRSIVPAARKRICGLGSHLRDDQRN